MPRPKKGTPESKLATQRWRQTMQERYGSASEFMKAAGAKGGSKPTNKPKGFAANPELAARVGSIGGRISRRNKKGSA